MKTRHISIYKALGIFIVAGILIFQTTLPSAVYADQIVPRTLTLQAGAGGDGGSMVSGVVNHVFSFTLPNTGDPDIGSIEFLYCTTAVGACVTPTDLDTTSATLTNQIGEEGFVIDSTTTPGAPFIHRTAAAVTTHTVGYTLNDVTNPSTLINPPTIPNQTFFVRISSFTSEDATGTAIDAGVVAASTANQIVLNGTMPESLVFCAGGTIDSPGDIPDCSSATTDIILFNQLFSPTDVATATSQMAASTNAGDGYNITVNGPTMENGGNEIDPMTTSAQPVLGLSQFGLNLKLNDLSTWTSVDPTVGAEVAVTSDGDNFRGQAATGYDAVNFFQFNDGDSVAKSDYLTPFGSNGQVFTVTYIVNVPGNLPAGTYSTTLTYICTPTF